MIVFSLFRNSTLRYERQSRTQFVIKAFIFLQDRDQFELTKNLSPAQFKRGNQFDDAWMDRITEYIDHVMGRVYEEAVPNHSQMIFETCIKTVKGRRRPAGFDGDHGHFQTHVKRDFNITIIFAQDDLDMDIPFFLIVNSYIHKRHVFKCRLSVFHHYLTCL